VCNFLFLADVFVVYEQDWNDFCVFCKQKVLGKHFFFEKKREFLFVIFVSFVRLVSLLGIKSIILWYTMVWYGEKIFEKFWENFFGKISLTWWPRGDLP